MISLIEPDICNYFHMDFLPKPLLRLSQISGSSSQAVAALLVAEAFQATENYGDYDHAEESKENKNNNNLDRLNTPSPDNINIPLSNEYFIFAPHSQSSPSSHQHYQPGLPGYPTLNPDQPPGLPGYPTLNPDQATGLPGYPGVLHSDHMAGLPGYPGILNPDEHSHKRNRTYSEDIVISYAMENDSDSMDENDDSIGIDDSTNHGNDTDHPAHINSIPHSIDTTDRSTCIDHGIDHNHGVSHVNKDVMNGSISHVNNLINRIDDRSPHLNNSTDHRLNSKHSINDSSSSSVVTGIRSYNLNSLSIASHKHGGVNSHINQDSDTSIDIISNDAIDSTSSIAPIDDSAAHISTRDNVNDSPTLIHGFIDHIDSSSGSNHGTSPHVTNSTNHSIDNSTTHNIATNSSSSVDNANFDGSWTTQLIPNNPSSSSTVSSYDNDVGGGGSMNHVDTNDGIDDDNDASDQTDDDHMEDNLIDVNDHADDEIGVPEVGIQAVLTEEIS
eukprot:CAMPEP_0119037234 /NCGR_PEP_ID=MMETSP1177-20130426/5467_1 /TAXON_ID=2985 /ORGANISM="Ochromonas sp, Strain CCMP1899" /LENGTH=499 /DNA_ID=CAMNT_0006998221 /DNA_START=94 /DNA_END=1594 /DNA_ORIENTATION=+